MSQPEHQRFDRSSKWLISHHGDAMLWLASLQQIADWRTSQAEVVQPRQLPDGLLEVRFHGETDYMPLLLEVATYPETRVQQQMTLDGLLVFADRNEWPEMVVLVLSPKGKYRIPAERRLRSRHGTSSCSIKWRVVELWKLSAADLLAAGNIGLIPWVMLTQSDESPASLAQVCRDRIEAEASSDERENLLAVTQVLAQLRYNDANLLTILGGKQVMIKSPLIEEIVAEATATATATATAARGHKSILEFLSGRFGDVPAKIEQRIRSSVTDDELSALTRLAATCSSLDDFREMAG